MYSPEVKARIEHIRASLPLAKTSEERVVLCREAVALIREGRMAAAVTSAASKARKAKAAVVDGDSLLADLEGSLGGGL
jgi:hypothetical protein